MKISGSDQISNLQTYIQNSKDKAGVEGPAKADKSPARATGQEKTSGGEKVKLSDRARELQQIEIELEKVPDVRKEKVAKIKEEIEQGNYKIKEEEIAAKMIRESIIDELL